MTAGAVVSAPAGVTIESGGTRVEIGADGGRIASIRFDGRELLVETPWARDPDDAWTMTSSSAEWHRRYRGGWHLLTPAAGDPAPDADVEQPFHGEAAWRTWRLRTDTPTTATAEVRLRTAPLRIVRTVTAAPGGLLLSTRIRNDGPDAQRIIWVEHPAFDGALFDDADLTVDDARVPICAAPGAAFDDRAVARGEATLLSRSAGIELRMTWDAALLPRLYLWQERRGTRGFPWWGGVDAVGLEPASDPYGAAAPGSGSVRVAPGEEIESRVEWAIRHLG